VKPNQNTETTETGIAAKNLDLPSQDKMRF